MSLSLKDLTLALHNFVRNNFAYPSLIFVSHTPFQGTFSVFLTASLFPYSIYSGLPLFSTKIGKTHRPIFESMA